MSYLKCCWLLSLRWEWGALASLLVLAPAISGGVRARLQLKHISVWKAFTLCLTSSRCIGRHTLVSCILYSNTMPTWIL
jgi:hypothetical protein